MTPYRNQKLFSNHYLERLLPEEKEFEINEAELKEAYQKIRALWDKNRFSSLNESQLRKHFLDKVFEILGWTVDVEPPTLIGDGIKHPDYALFYSKNDLKVVQKTPKEKYFKHVACLAEAKRWERNLDKKIKSDPEDIQNPSLQMSHYLWLTEVKWGILTNGRYWRLYERETSKKIDIFYEIDLESLLENGKLEDFRYFYLFFRKDAFPAFVEKVYQGSKDYAEAVGEELKENVYESLRLLAHGFLEFPNNNLSQNDLKKIHDNSLIFLYRLLFILYAEYNQLLPLGENKAYTDYYSLDAIKKEITDKIDKRKHLPISTHTYWDRLKELFEIINNGNKELDVPPYNGGLFDPKNHHFLEDYKVGDAYVAKVIDLLSRSKEKAFIDYSSLDIRHLGSIYEGLLEYKLRIAKEDLVPIKQKGREVYVSLKEAKKQGKKIDKNKVVHAGEVYLVTDKGERKATGSYYTPRYIVKYIIENTLDPLIEQIRKEAKLAEEIFAEIVKGKNEEEVGELQQLWQLTKSDREKKDILLNLLDGVQPKHQYDPITRILQLKILDPAMGSGHFLVEATDFLAKALIEALGASPKEVGEDEIRWARREIVERCIFGVDLNPLAVELAKLSLWLYTVAKGRPLSFLDHHLRCGNSLIGAKINELATLPDLKKKKTKKGRYIQPEIFECIFYEKVNILLKAFELIETQPSDTVEQIREKEKLYRDFCRIVSRFQDIADVWMSIYFGNKVSLADYQELLNNLRAPDQEWEAFKAKPWFKKAKEITGQKRFFHWELEFPEIFFEGDKRKKNPGFDAVVGNPPYIRFHNLNTEEIPYFADSYNYASGQFDAFALMLERGLNELKFQGRFGFIMPDLFLRGLQYEEMRRMFLKNTTIKNIIELGDRVFPDVQMPTCLFLYSKSFPKDNDIHLRVRVGKHMKDYYIKQDSFLNIPGVPLDPQAGTLLPSVMKCSLLLKKISKINRGIEIGKDKVHRTQKKDVLPVLSGDEVQRYVPEGLVFVSREIVQTFSKSPEIFAPPKLIIRETGGILLGCFDNRGFLTLRTLHNVRIIHKMISEKYILSLLNSKLLQRVFEFCFKQAGDIFPKIRITQEHQLPIRRISFVTPENERKRLLKKFKKMYYDFLKEGN